MSEVCERRLAKDTHLLGDVVDVDELYWRPHLPVHLEGRPNLVSRLPLGSPVALTLCRRNTENYMGKNDDADENVSNHEYSVPCFLLMMIDAKERKQINTLVAHACKPGGRGRDEDG